MSILRTSRPIDSLSKVLCNDFSFLINRISPTTLRAKEGEKMINNIQCELASRIDRPPKRVVQQRPVHLGFFSFFEKRTEMPGIRNLNSK